MRIKMVKEELLEGILIYLLLPPTLIVVLLVGLVLALSLLSLTLIHIGLEWVVTWLRTNIWLRYLKNTD